MTCARCGHSRDEHSELSALGLPYYGRCHEGECNCSAYLKPLTEREKEAHGQVTLFA